MYSETLLVSLYLFSHYSIDDKRYEDISQLKRRELN